MNFYFLLEDEKSFLKVLPNWLEYMGVDYKRVADIQEVEENNYILQSGQGVTQLVTKVLFDTIDTILLNPGKIDNLIVILDAEELKVEERKSDFYPFYIHYNIEMNDPERMSVPEGKTETIAKYHFHYLHELLRYKKIRYSKSRPGNIATKDYFNGIVDRVKTTEHLNTFKEFYDFFLQ